MKNTQDPHHLRLTETVKGAGKGKATEEDIKIAIKQIEELPIGFNFIAHSALISDAHMIRNQFFGLSMPANGVCWFARISLLALWRNFPLAATTSMTYDYSHGHH